MSLTEAPAAATATGHPAADAQAADAAPLVARLVSTHGACWVDSARLDAFLAPAGDRVLFFHGDPVRFPECLDVAVVLPELQAAYPARFSVGVVARSDDEALARRFGVTRRPTLLFVRDGHPVTQVAGMLDWPDFLESVAQALDGMGPSRSACSVSPQGGDTGGPAQPGPRRTRGPIWLRPVTPGDQPPLSSGHCMDPGSR